jgi:hypothetical protein
VSRRKQANQATVRSTFQRLGRTTSLFVVSLDPFYQDTVTSAVIVVAVGVSVMRARRAQRGRT